MRDAKRLAAIRKLPCVVCGRSPVDAAHSNQSNHGKGMGLKQMINTLFRCAILAILILINTKRWVEKNQKNGSIRC